MIQRMEGVEFKGGEGESARERETIFLKRFQEVGG